MERKRCAGIAGKITDGPNRNMYISSVTEFRQSSNALSMGNSRIFFPGVGKLGVWALWGRESPSGVQGWLSGGFAGEAPEAKPTTCCENDV